MTRNNILSGIKSYVIKKDNSLKYGDEAFSEFNTDPEKPFHNSCFAIFNGIKIHYRVWGDISWANRETKKILLGHGLGGSTYSWNKISNYLKNTNYIAVAPDYPNFGYSERVFLKYDPRVFAGILYEIIKKVDGDMAASSTAPLTEQTESQNKWHLVAHSTSGFIMTCLARSNEEVVASLTYTAPAISKNILRNVLFGTPLVSEIVRKNMQNSVSLHGIARMLEFVYSQYPEPADIYYYYHPLTLRNTIDCLHYMLSRTDQPGVKTANNNYASVNPRIPVFLIWGDRDKVNPIRKSKQLLKLKPDSEMEVISNCGHCPMETKPEEFYSLLKTL